MFNYLSLFLIAILSTITIGSLYAQPAIEWERSLGGSGYEIGFSIVSTTDHGFAVAGHTNSNNGDVLGLHSSPTDSSDFWIVKLNSSGITIWQKCLGGSGREQAHSIIQTRDGGYAVAGYTTSNNGDVNGWHGQKDFWIVKLDSIGKIEWQKTFGGSGDDEANSIFQTSDGGYTLTGVTTSTDGDVKGYHPDAPKTYLHGDAWVLKLDTSGGLEWQKTLGGSKYETAKSIIQSSNNDYWIAGTTFSSDGDVSAVDHSQGCYWIIKLDSTGSILWQKTYGGSRYNTAESIIQTRDGKYVIAGMTQSYDEDICGRDTNYGTFWVIGINDTGKIEWKRTGTGKRETYATCVIQTQDKGFALTGWNENGGRDTSNLFLIKLDSVGNLQWNKSLGGTKYDRGFSICQSREGGYAVVGFTGSSDGDVTGFHGGADIWVVKLLPYTNAVPILPKFTEANFSLSPNPGNGFEKITYELQNGSQTQIEVYDPIGRLVRTIVNVAEQSGLHEHEFNLTSLPSGQYFFRLRSGEISVVKGFVLEK